MQFNTLKSVDLSSMREESHLGIDYLVLPVVAMIEGVRNAASEDGEYALALAKEFGKYVDSWNSVPLVIHHPEEPRNSGNYVSACTHDIEEKYSIGHTTNTVVDGDKLKMEAWINLDRIESVEDANLMLELIANDQMVEISVGFFSDALPQPGSYKGTPYDVVWANYVPDHLALLPGEVGACSIEDGCGIPRINQKNKDSKMPVKLKRRMKNKKLSSKLSALVREGNIKKRKLLIQKRKLQVQSAFCERIMDDDEAFEEAMANDPKAVEACVNSAESVESDGASAEGDDTEPEVNNDTADDLCNAVESASASELEALIAEHGEDVIQGCLNDEDIPSANAEETYDGKTVDEWCDIFNADPELLQQALDEDFQAAIDCLEAGKITAQELGEPEDPGLDPEMNPEEDMEDNGDALDKGDAEIIDAGKSSAQGPKVNEDFPPEDRDFWVDLYHSRTCKSFRKGKTDGLDEVEVDECKASEEAKDHYMKASEGDAKVDVLSAGWDWDKSKIVTWLGYTGWLRTYKGLNWEDWADQYSGSKAKVDCTPVIESGDTEDPDFTRCSDLNTLLDHPNWQDEPPNNKPKNNKRSTLKAYLDDAPTEIREALEEGLHLQRQHKGSLVGTIMDVKTNKFKPCYLRTLSIPVLENMVALIGSPKSIRPQKRNSYLGVTPPNVNSRKNPNADFPTPPRLQDVKKEPL